MKPEPESTIDGQSILVLGGSGGIGLAIARACSQKPVHLIVHGRDASKLNSLEYQLQTETQTAARISTLCLDLDNPEKVPELVAAVKTCDILIISRGAFIQKPLRATDWTDWQSMAYSNFSLPGLLASTAASAMAGRGYGRILLFGGTRTETVRGYRHNAAYAAAKTGLAVITKSIAAEFADSGVAISMICPGFVDTEYQSDSAKESLRKLAPGGQLLPAEQVAKLALFLIEGGMDTVNGAIINADGGLYSL